MKITIKDIAQDTGVSASTISRVVNNSGYVKDETRKTVEEAIARCGYVKSKKANGSSALTNAVLIIVESINNNVYADYIAGICRHLRKHGKNPYIYVSDYSPEAEIDQLMFANKAGFSGVFMLSAVESSEIVEVLKNISCPVVLVNRYLRALDIDTVILDNYKVGFMATMLLINNGHTRIAHLGGPLYSTASQDRLRGYTDAMGAAGLKIDPRGMYSGNLTYECGCDFARDILPYMRDFTALFSANDTMAVGFIDTILENGFECPGDISVICADDSFDVLISKVKLTTIGYDSKVMGRSAAELLLERINNVNGKKKTISFSPNIIERNSIINLKELN